MTHPSTTDNPWLDLDPEIWELIEPHFKVVMEAERTIHEQKQIISRILSADFLGFRNQKYGFDFAKRKYYRLEKETE